MNESLKKSEQSVDYGLVSIVMPNYNGGKYLKETIDSVLSQTYDNWELLFVDDCSTDNSLEIVRSYADERIRIFQNEKNSGAAVSRNYALRMAKGKWIAFLDSDDLWEKEKLEKQLHFMIDNNIAFTYTPYFQIDELSKPLNIEVSGPKKIGRRKMYRYDYIGCLTVIYDHEKVGVIQVEPTLKSRNDYAIWLKVSKYCDCYLFNKYTAKYRVRKNSLSHSGLAKLICNQYMLFRVGERMGALKALYHTLINMFFGVWKKIHYVKKFKNIKG